MAKKPFAWIRDAEEPWVPSPERVSRSEAAEVVEEADRLLEAVLALRPTERGELPLDAELVREIAAYERIATKNRVARKRQHGLLRKRFRERDLKELSEALAGASTRDEQLAALVRWRERLVDEGDAALQAFVDAHPDADRQQLRSLARHAGGEGQRAVRAKKALMAALREAAGL